MVYVIYDQEEALSLSDRVAVMRDGHVLQVAVPKVLYERPSTRFVADFVGTNNFIAGVCRETTGAHCSVETPLGMLKSLATPAVAPGAACVVVVRPENLTLDGGGENVLQGKVVLASYLGSVLRYDVATAEGPVLKVDVRDPWHHVPLPPGQSVRVTFSPSDGLTLAGE